MKTNESPKQSSSELCGRNFTGAAENYNSSFFTTLSGPLKNELPDSMASCQSFRTRPLSYFMDLNQVSGAFGFGLVLDPQTEIS